LPEIPGAFSYNLSGAGEMPRSQQIAPSPIALSYEEHAAAERNALGELATLVFAVWSKRSDAEIIVQMINPVALVTG
jgi:hypothetical protein